MAVKFLDKTGLGYFWGKIKAWCNSTFAAIAHTHTSYAVKHSYTTAANAAKNWYRIANANTQQLDINKPIRAQFIVTAYNTSYAADYYETWFVNAIVFGRTAHISIFGNTSIPFSQARILYENTVANIDANDRPAIDLYLNYVLPNGTTKVEVEEIYNNGWTFIADGQLAVSSVPSGFENVAGSVRNNGIEQSTYADYVSYLNRQVNNFTAAFTLADSYLYRSRTLNCTGTFTITIPSINSGYMWCVIKNKNTSSGVITLHPSTTSVLIDGSNADITLQPMEYVCIHSAGANNYSLIADGRWKSQKADKATTLAGYGITDAKIANGTITLGSNSITPLTSVPSHNQASNTINAMTGYSKPSSGSAIAASDSLNDAIGKLEVKIDSIDDTSYVHITGDENITGTKTFVGSKKIAFKQSGANDKLGFTLYNNSDKEQGYLEYNPTNKIAGVPLFTLGNYATATNELTYVGFRRYSNISGASGAYNLLAPLISDAKTPFNLTTTYTNFYLPLGISDGTNIVKASNSGVVDISSLLTLTGYTKPSSGSALVTTDTIKQALGKLEAKVDTAVASSDGIPVGSIVWLSTSTVPTGFLLCNGQAVGRTTYSDLFTAIGTTYGSGDGSTTFNLPNLIDKFIEGTNNNVGTSVAAGLPNITGAFRAGTAGYYVPIRNASGAFTGTANASFNTANSSGGNVTDYSMVDFNASNSNSIYGNSATVQPSALKLLPCIKAYNSVSNISELDAAQLENELQNNYVHLTGDETIYGTKTFVSTIHGNIITANKIDTTPSGITYVSAVTEGNALVNANTTEFGAIWNAPTKNYRVGCATYPSNNDQILWYSVTNSDITTNTNTVDKRMSWDAATGTLTTDNFNGVLTKGQYTLKATWGAVRGAKTITGCVVGKPLLVIHKLTAKVDGECNSYVKVTSGAAVANTNCHHYMIGQQFGAGGVGGCNSFICIPTATSVTFDFSWNGSTKQQYLIYN